MLKEKNKGSLWEEKQLIYLEVFLPMLIMEVMREGLQASSCFVVLIQRVLITLVESLVFQDVESLLSLVPGEVLTI